MSADLASLLLVWNPGSAKPVGKKNVRIRFDLSRHTPIPSGRSVVASGKNPDVGDPNPVKLLPQESI